ncbi:hypothetical protein [Romboutsia timonensis]|uniref:hypothetical protein n=1 Tax=Romboutsia timonensis TaxID=1776391 RepID=UPI002A81A518|nr:hypothetical protein [Romboutsia timonensis]MDY3960944.1 hypothetical protein [Romboutsia timonensis]
MNAEELLKSYNLNLASIEYLTRENQSIEALLERLSKDEKMILVSLYIHKMDISQIKNNMQYEKSQLNELKNEAIKKLDRIINNNSSEKINVEEWLSKYVINIDTITYLTRLNNSIDSMLNTILPIEKQILVLRYFENKSVSQLKMILQYSAKSIYNYKVSALKKINYILNPISMEG